MSPKENLSNSAIDYLEAIDLLTRAHGHAHTKDIAGHLKVKMPSVTIALQQLSQRGFVKYSSHQPVQLTEKGQRIANRVAHNHRALESFFQRALGLTPEVAHRVSCSIDHIVDEDITRRLVVFSKAVANRADCTALTAYLTRAMEFINTVPEEHHEVISVLPPRTKCRFESGPPEIPLKAGENFELGERTLDGRNVVVLAGRRRFLVPLEQAWLCWAQVEEEGE